MVRLLEIMIQMILFWTIAQCQCFNVAQQPKLLCKFYNHTSLRQEEQIYVSTFVPQSIPTASSSLLLRSHYWDNFPLFLSSKTAFKTSLIFFFAHLFHSLTLFTILLSFLQKVSANFLSPLNVVISKIS